MIKHDILTTFDSDTTYYLKSPQNCKIFFTLPCLFNKASSQQADISRLSMPFCAYITLYNHFNCYYPLKCKMNVVQ